MNKSKFRRICMESSEHNWANISGTICLEMLVFGGLGLLGVFLLE